MITRMPNESNAINSCLNNALADEELRASETLQSVCWVDSVAMISFQWACSHCDPRFLLHRQCRSSFVAFFVAHVLTSPKDVFKGWLSFCEFIRRWLSTFLNGQSWTIPKMKLVDNIGENDVDIFYESWFSGHLHLFATVLQTVWFLWTVLSECILQAAACTISFSSNDENGSLQIRNQHCGLW